MLGAIAGDIIGSVYEGSWNWLAVRTPHFEPLFRKQSRFTDDTVLTVAVADSLLHGSDLIDLLKEYARAYPRAGYGSNFFQWALSEDRDPYYSWGNGSAMRVSPIGFACETLDEVLARAQWSACVTHDHPEGIKGAQATAAAIFLARHGESKEGIRSFLEQQFGYDLNSRLADFGPGHGFDISCQVTVPTAILAFLESRDYEEAVRLAVAVGGDTDTLACITGGIAQAFYGGVPDEVRQEALDRLDDRLRGIVEEFEKRYLPTSPTRFTG